MHLVWDWNGTLLDDFDLTIAATNAAFHASGGPNVTGDEHRRRFRRPIAEYYAEVLGRPVDEAEFAAMDTRFHSEYHRMLATCRLAAGAAEALAAWSGSQSLLSMWFHEQLVPFVAGFGLADRFVRIDGLREATGGGNKAEHLVRHLAALRLDGADCVLIGDTLDDADAAAAVGAGCVLVSYGYTDGDRLAATGLPVADTLADAVKLASA